eukprot:XP_001696006.1 predicted protein [Chlamydomonas reinhardtii]
MSTPPRSTGPSAGASPAASSARPPSVSRTVGTPTKDASRAAATTTSTTGQSTSRSHTSASSSSRAAGASAALNAQAEADMAAQLQERLAQLEADTQASQDQAQWTIKQNKNTLLALKQENKDLSAEVSRRGGSNELQCKSGSATDGGKVVERLERQVHELRRGHDKIAKVWVRPAARELRQLQNRLDKATVKADEAYSIRKTYEQVLEKLRVEEPLLEARIRGLQEQRATKQSAMQAATLQQTNRTLMQRQFQPLVTSSSEAAAHPDSAAASPAGKPSAAPTDPTNPTAAEEADALHASSLSTATAAAVERGEGGQPAVPVEDETLGDVLAQIESRLHNAYKLIATLPKAAELLEANYAALRADTGA